MLLLITPWPMWASGAAAPLESAVDRQAVWAFINALLIHERAYPLFAMLFDFRLAMVSNAWLHRAPSPTGSDRGEPGSGTVGC